MLGDQAHPKQRLTGREINFERIAHRLRETRRQLARLVTSLVSLLSPAVPVACDTLLHINLVDLCSFIYSSKHFSSCSSRFPASDEAQNSMETTRAKVIILGRGRPGVGQILPETVEKERRCTHDSKVPLELLGLFPLDGQMCVPNLESQTYSLGCEAD
jgi:hypothetical protein